MATEISKAILKDLAGVNASYHFVHRQTSEPGKNVACSIVSNGTGTVFAVGYGSDESLAIVDAHAKAMSVQAPQTEDEMRSEIARLKAQLQSASSAPAPAPEQTQDAKPEPIAENGPTERDEIKSLLNESGVRFDGRASTETLVQLAKDNDLL